MQCDLSRQLWDTAQDTAPRYPPAQSRRKKDPRPSISGTSKFFVSHFSTRGLPHKDRPPITCDMAVIASYILHIERPSCCWSVWTGSSTQ